MPALGHAPTFNYLLQQKFYHTAIEPVLGKHAVRQELVILHNCGIVDKLNALLREIDHTRKAKFRGTFVGQADWGFLVEDMRPEGEIHSIHFCWSWSWPLLPSYFPLLSPFDNTLLTTTSSSRPGPMCSG